MGSPLFKKWTSRHSVGKLSRVVGISIFSLFALHGCFHSDEDPVVVPIVSAKTNVIADPSTINALDPSSVATGTLVFDASAPSGLESVNLAMAEDDPTISAATSSLAGKQAGDVLMIEPTANLPGGVFKKVVSVQTIDDQVIVQTEDADITDVVDQGRVSLSGTIAADPSTLNLQAKGAASALIESHDGFQLYDAKRVRDLKQKAVYEAGIDIGELNECEEIVPEDGLAVEPELLVKYELPLSNFASGSPGSIDLTGYPSVIKGCMALILDYEVNLWIEAGQLKEFKFISKPTTYTEMTLETKAGVTFEKEKTIVEFTNLPTINFSIGPVPVWIQPQVNIVVGAEGTVGATVITGTSIQRDIRAGLQFVNGVWEPVAELYEHYVLQPPTFTSLGAEVELSAGPELLTKLYSAAGPKVGVKGVLAASADAISNPWWKIEGGITGEAGLEVGLFGQSANVSFPLFEEKGVIASAAGTIDDPPEAPTNITTAQGIGAINIDWDPSLEATTYNIYWSTSPGVTSESSTFRRVGTSFRHAHLTNGTTYYYRIAAANGSGEGPLSAEFSDIADNRPAAPMPVDFTASGMSGRVTLEWVKQDIETVELVDSYKLYWSTSPGVTDADDFISFNSNYRTGTQIKTISGLAQDGTTYYFRLQAVNSEGASTLSAEVSVVPIGAPGRTFPRAIPGDGLNTISWSEDPLVDTYNLYWSTSYDDISDDLAIKIPDVSSPYVHAGLTNGTKYYYRLEAVNSAGSNERRFDTTSATPREPFTAEPTNVTVTPGSEQNVVSWSDALGAVYYNIYWSESSTVSGEDYEGKIYRITDTTYTHTDLVPGNTYFYLIEAVNEFEEKTSSSVVSGAPIQAIPQAPYNLRASARDRAVVLEWNDSVEAKISSNFDLFWTSIPTYNIYWSTAPGINLQTAHKISNVNSTREVPELRTSTNEKVTSTTYTHTGLTNEITYYYVVTAVNSSGESVVSSELSAKPVAATEVPNSPTIRSVETGDQSVTINWTTSVTGGAAAGINAPSSYNLYWSTSPALTKASGNPITSITGNSYVHTALTNGTTYYYIIEAVNLVGSSPASALVLGVPQPPPLPAAPTSVTAIGGVEVNTISWVGSTGSIAYNLNWSDGTTSGVITNVQSPYMHVGITPDVTYTYSVTGVDKYSREGAKSSDVTAVASAVAAIPDPPTDLVVTPNDGDNAIEWTPSAGASSYNVYWSTSPGVSGTDAKFTVYSTLSGTTKAISNHSALVNGTTYYYRISAVNAEGESALSATEVSGTPAPLFQPYAPDSVDASAGNAENILTWIPTSISGTSTISYNIYWSTSPDVTTTDNKIGNISGTSYTHTGLTNGTTYYYVVSAQVAGYESAVSWETSATPTSPPPVPVNVAATPGRISNTVSWDSVAGASSYNLYWSTSTGVSKSSSKITDVKSPIEAYGDDSVTYYYVVTAENGSGESAVSSEVSATITTIPTVPSSVSATAGTGEVALSWSSDSIATSYVVYWSATSDFSSASSTTLGAVTDSTYTVTGLTNGTKYYFAVTAVGSDNGVTVETDKSSVISATPADPVSKPMNVAATSSVSSNIVSWDANAAGESAVYNIYWSTSPGVTASDNKISGVVGTSYIHAGLTNGTSYYYVLSAENALGESAISSEVSAMPSETPSVPTDLVVSLGQSDESVISWGSSPGATSYNIYWDTAAGVTTSSNVINVAATMTSYNHTGLAAGTSYHYILTAVNSAAVSVGESAPTSELSVTTGGLATPVNVVATLTSSGVTLTWDAVPNAESYVVRWSSTVDGTKNILGTVTTNMIDDTTPGSVGDTIYYFVQATDTDAGNPDSADSAAVSVTIVDAVSTPVGITVTSNVGQNTVSWTTNPATEGASYNIYRSTTPSFTISSSNRVASSLSGNTFVDTGLTAGTTYYYAVTAINALGESSGSAEQSGTPFAIPLAPTDVTVGLNGTNDSPVISWTASIGATSYKIYWDTASGITTSSNVISDLSSTTYTHAGLTTGEIYYYRVSAVNAQGESALSSEDSVPLGDLATPVNVVATGGVGQISLSWDVVSGAANYEVYRGTTLAEAEARINMVGGMPTTTNSIIDSDAALVSGSTYYYVVVAIATGGTGSSFPSATVSAVAQ